MSWADGIKRSKRMLHFLHSPMYWGEKEARGCSRRPRVDGGCHRSTCADARAEASRYSVSLSRPSSTTIGRCQVRCLYPNNARCFSSAKHGASTRVGWTCGNVAEFDHFQLFMGKSGGVYASVEWTFLAESLADASSVVAPGGVRWSRKSAYAT